MRPMRSAGGRAAPLRDGDGSSACGPDPPTPAPPAAGDDPAASAACSPTSAGAAVRSRANSQPCNTIARTYTPTAAMKQRSL